MDSGSPVGQEVWYVFVASNSRGRLLVDVTSNLPLTMRWLKAGAYDRRCRLKRIDRLVWFEIQWTAADADARLQDLRKLNRRRLNLLIDETNPQRTDLSAHWFPVFAADHRDDDEPDGGVLATLPHGPIGRGPGYEQAWPDLAGPDTIPIHA